MLVIAPFNGIFWLSLAFFFLACTFLVHACKGKEKEERRNILFLFYCGILLLFVYYKIVILFFDPTYSQICLEAGVGATSIWKELPFNPCNICMLLIVFALKKNNRLLLSSCYHLSLFGAFFALYAPNPGFAGYNLLTPRIFCFYFIHYAILLMPYLLDSLDLYQPEYREIPKTMAFLVSLSFLAHLFNTVVRSTGLEPHVNYFFTYEPVSLLKILYSWMPIPYLYMLPVCIPLLMLYMVLLTALSKGIEKGKNQMKA